MFNFANEASIATLSRNLSFEVFDYSSFFSTQYGNMYDDLAPSSVIPTPVGEGRSLSDNSVTGVPGKTISPQSSL